MKDSKENLKLNIGCGPNGLENWLNYDWGILPFLSKFSLLRSILIKFRILNKDYEIKWPPIKLVNIRGKFPLKDNSTKYIYCSHVLEHFERWEAIEILKECRRVLVKGGSIRIIVPNIEKMVDTYKEEKMNKDQKDRPGRNICRTWWGYDKDIEPKGFIQKFARKFIRDHHWNYDKYELELILREAGFNENTECGFRRGIVPDIDKLDIESYKEHSLYLESTK